MTNICEGCDLRDLHTGTKLEFYYSRPAVVQIDITNLCSLDCKYCYNKINDFLNEKEMDDEILLQVVEKVATQLNPLGVGFTGGEPLIRSEILIKCILLLEKYNINTSINTNATMFTEEILLKLKQSGLSSININLENTEIEHHNHLRGANNAFPNVFDSLLLAKKIFGSDKINIRTVINKKNLHNLLDIAKYVKKYGFASYQLIDMIPTSNNEKALILNREEWKEFFKIYKKIIKLGIEIKPNHAILFSSELGKEIPLTFCMAGRLQMIICANGNIVPCTYFKKEEYVCGNAISDNLLNVWQESSIMKKFRYSIEGYQECYNCDKLKTCAGGCKALSLGLNGEAFSPDPYCIDYKLNDV